MHRSLLLYVIFIKMNFFHRDRRGTIPTKASYGLGRHLVNWKPEEVLTNSFVTHPVKPKNR